MAFTGGTGFEAVIGIVGVIVFAFLFTFWITLLVGILAGALYERSRSAAE
ncbi:MULTISPECIES: hypothetical protein [unclassified Haloarcula]|nr:MULTISPECIES: hypothetical protein [unclassified Haloarcula]